MTDNEDDIARLLRAAGARVEPSPEALTRMRAAVHAEWKASLRERRPRLWQLAIAASGLVFALTVGFVLTRDASPSVDVARITLRGDDTRVVRGGTDSNYLKTDVLTLGDEIAAGAGGVTLAQLPSGRTSLRLDRGTRAQWVTASTLRLMSGRIYVDTGSGGSADPPQSTDELTILVGEARIRHVGTQFMTSAIPSGFQVLVRDGLVRIDRGTRTETLARGESALLPADDPIAIERLRSAASGPAWAWADSLAPYLQIDGRDLLTVLQTAAREVGLRVEYTDAGVERRVAQITLHGPALTLPPDRAIRALLSTTPFAVAEGSDAKDDRIVVGLR